MKIKIEGLEDTFSVLSLANHVYRRTLDDEDDEDDKDDKEVWETTKKIKTATTEDLEKLEKASARRDYSVSPLGFPFKGIIFSTMTIGLENNYAASVTLFTEEEWIFKGMSNELERLVKQNPRQQYRFERTSEDGTGYFKEYYCLPGSTHKNIQDKNSIVAYSIEEGRGFTIGKNGTYPRTLTGLNGFMSEIKQLERIVNLYIEAAINPLVQIQRLPPLPQSTVPITIEE